MLVKLCSNIEYFINYTLCFTNSRKYGFKVFDAGNVWGVDYSSSLDESNSIRTSTGFALEILTPVGPLSFLMLKQFQKPLLIKQVL